MSNDELIMEEDVLLEESNDSNEQLSPPTENEVKEIIESTKIEVSEEEIQKLTEKKKGRKSSVKKDIPTSQELSNMSDDEVVAVAGEIDSETQDLYLEFGSFLVDKVKIQEDSGVKEVIPTGIDVLDTVLGGGFAIGTMGMVAGLPGSGKSMICIQAMGNAQLKYKGKILVSFLDAEEATTTIRLSNLGVKYPRIKPYNDITVEKVFKFIEGTCTYKEIKDIVDIPSLVVWDSVANTLSQKEREVEDINSALGYKSRLLSILIPKYVAKLSKYNICLLAVNQLRDLIQIGPYSSPKELNFMRQGKTIPGGNALKYNAFQFLDMKVKSVVDAEKFGFDGIISEVKCIKNKLFPPNISVNIVGNFVTGFNNFWTNYLFLTETKRVVNAGGWIYLVTNPSKKFRTKESESLYKTDPEFKENFDNLIKEALKTELVDKYNIII